MKNAFSPATSLYGSLAFPFVIPSEAEGSAVPRTIPGNVFRTARAGQGRGEVAGFTALRARSADVK